jgi:hypothetical protein
VFKAKQHRNRLVRVEMGKLKKSAKSAGKAAATGKKAGAKPKAKK